MSLGAGRKPASRMSRHVSPESSNAPSVALSGTFSPSKPICCHFPQCNGLVFETSLDLNKHCWKIHRNTRGPENRSSPLSQTRALLDYSTTFGADPTTYQAALPFVDSPLNHRHKKRATRRVTSSVASPTPSIRSGINKLTLDESKKKIKHLSGPESPANARKRTLDEADVTDANNLQPSPEKQSNSSGLRPSIQPQLTNQQLLLKEVAGLYRAVCLAEERCLHEDAKFRNLRGSDGQLLPLEDNQWKALLILHKTLFSEINDFLLASQHPQASEELKQRARQLNIPARLWRVAIHSLLEILRHRLPASQEFLLSFMYTVYSHMTLLLETVPLFKDTWIECLGDLSRFRMAVEEINFKDREIWCGVSRYWYGISADRNPHVGRLQHHLAILARPNLLAQLHYYAKSLTVSDPFINTRDSIRTLFDPVIQGTVFQHPYFQPSDILFIKLNGFLFLQKNLSNFDIQVEKFLVSFEESLEILGPRNLERGPYFVVSNVATLLGYGSQDNIISTEFPKTNDKLNHPMTQQAGLKQLTTSHPAKMELDDSEQYPGTLEACILAGSEDGVRKLIKAGADVNIEGGVYGRPLNAAITSGNPRMVRLLLDAGASVQTKGRHGSPLQGALFADSPVITQILETEEAMNDLFRSKRILHSKMLALVLRRKEDDSLLSFVHASLVFIHALTFHPEKMRFLEDSIPWQELVTYLEHIRTAYPQAASVLQVDEFPGLLKGARPLPEDYILRGLTWSNHYFPPRFHEDAGLELDERNLERDSQKEDRQKRNLWLGKEIATRSNCLDLDSDFHFRVGLQAF